jgi:ubiquinol-cytochrome c reductase cytochrome b subunit
VVDVIVLTWIGGSPAEGKFILIGRIATIYYFAHFLLLMPIVGVIETPKPLPNSISQSVLNKPIKGNS